MMVNKLLMLRTLAGWLISHWVITVCSAPIACPLLSLCKYRGTQYYFQSIWKKKLTKLCFSSGVLFMHCVCLLAMTQRLNLDLKAEQTQLAKSFRFWSLGRLWLVAERSCGFGQLLRHRGDQRLCYTSLESFPSSPLCRCESVWTFLSRRVRGGSWTPGL